MAATHGVLAAAFGAREGFLTIARRSAQRADDPLKGFRLEQSYALGPRAVTMSDWVEGALAGAQHVVLADPVMQRIAADAGRHRVYHDGDPRTQPGLERTIGAHLWNEKGLVDRLKLTFAFDADREVHFGFDRFVGEEPFGAEDEAKAERVLPLVGEWVRRVLLLHGLLPGQVALTARERDVVAGLLGPEPLKRIAAAYGVSEARAREVVRAIYGKLGVGGRLELASAFLGPGSEPDAVFVSTAVSRRRPPWLPER